ncbi:MAG: replicative DNA helicase [Clostridiales bacterium]|nr:replicative DNA helicase [Clostridiales bacterium]
MNPDIPFSKEAERAVLGALLLSADQVAFVGGVLAPDDFFLDAHRRIYDAILALYDAGAPVDLITVGEELKRRGELEGIGGFSYLADLAKEVPTVHLASHYARIIKERSIARKLYQTGLHLQTMIRTGANADTALVEAHQSLQTIEKDYQETRLPPLAADVLIHEILLPLKRGARVQPRFSGWPSLDALLGGFRGGQLIIIGARPSHGKTTFALNLALSMAKTAPALFFSLETSRRMLTYRILSILQGRPYQAYLDLDHLPPGTQKDLEDAARHLLRHAPLYLDDEAGLTAGIMAAKTRAIQLRSEKGLSGVFIDYLQLIPGKPGATAFQRVQELTSISYELKAMAQRFDIPVFVLSQLNRQIEQRSDKRPYLSDLRDSGGIEAAADVVLLLHRPGVHDPSLPPHQLDVYVEKHRDGKTGKITLHADFSTMFISDPSAPTREMVAGDERDPRRFRGAV